MSYCLQILKFQRKNAFRLILVEQRENNNEHGLV